MSTRASKACAPILLLLLAGCAHPNRISRSALGRLTKKGEHFVLVFGSLSTPRGQLERPTIRFVHPGSSAAQDFPLLALSVSTGNRFYAILHAPSEAPYLDSFYTEVGAETVGFDRILYAHMREGQEPLAMYVGEIEVRPAANRAAQGQKVIVEKRDDFENARQELRRLYPRFDGEIVRLGLVQSPGPLSPTPPRVQ